MPSEKKLRKYAFRERMEKYMDEYSSILIIGVDNVGSNMLQQVRLALRGEAAILMGKNTMMRKIVREKAETDSRFSGLIDAINGNIGFLFTNGDLAAIRKKVLEFKVPAAAKTGAFAPTDVWVPKGSTGLDPGQTNFFQALNIATKIVRGSIEIVNDVHMIVAGERITASASVLLAKLGVKPFFFKFGQGYILEIKLPGEQESLESDDESGEHVDSSESPLEVFIKEMFPRAEQPEKFGSRWTYKIDREDAMSLSKIFAKLEEAKVQFGIEEYSFSQSTLEQVFLRFAKEQAENDEEEQQRQERIKKERRSKRN